MVLARVRRTLHERGLLEGSSTVLVACSGGPDSQVLLHVLHALQGEHGRALVVASVDHGLRPEAQADVAIARTLAEQLGLPFRALRVQVEKGPSRQALARRARYDALWACARELGAELIAVGHTLDDQAETVLARLLRGTGIEGLSAVNPRRADGVIRPLIDVRRADVQAYALRHRLPVAHDPSNQDERYLRVRVRNRHLPVLSQENPSFPVQLAALADDAREAREVLDQAARAALLRAQGRADTLREESPYVRRWALRVWAEQLIERPLQRSHLYALDRMLWNGGQVRLPGDHIASIGVHGELVLSRTSKRGRGQTRPTEG